MSDIGLENGFARIANQTLEVMAKVKLSPTQYRILFVVWRYTYGFQRKAHQLSLSFLSEATQCDLRLIQRELKKLISMGILQVYQGKGQSRELGFNKQVSEWHINNGKITIGEIDNGKADNRTIGEIDNRTIGEIDNQERKNKEKYKEKDLQSVFDFYLSLNLKKHRAFTKDMIKAIERAIKNNSYDLEYCKLLLERHKKVVDLTKNQKYPVRARGFSEFFGQKVYGGTHLICSEYEEGGRYFEQYLKDERPKEELKKPLRLVIRDHI